MKSKLDRKKYWLTSKGERSHFHAKETACPCGCGFNEVEQKLLDQIERARLLMGSPIIITNRGGLCRCSAYNAKAGGHKGSFHLSGAAADCYTPKLSKTIFYLFCEKCDLSGIGYYYASDGNFLHVDTGPRYQRWVKKQGRYIYMFEQSSTSLVYKAIQDSIARARGKNTNPNKEKECRSAKPTIVNSKPKLHISGPRKLQDLLSRLFPKKKTVG